MMKPAEKPQPAKLSDADKIALIVELLEKNGFTLPKGLK